MRNRIYIIVPKADAENNYTMLNHSTSRQESETKKTTDESNWIFEAKDADNIDPVFDPYQWYTHTEILTELETDEAWGETG